ncbi:putative exonuclease GOR [Aquila chrysaetos chrysaetos]|uniref:putative exonuclease GOR n=1 Tax=Aquila chrysaetos chrysaetos TaxID=223781 RepID=UPI001176CC7E|nr:putative exonuclease GOR [Aquila chrysaetos chrysaetos]
MMLSKGCAVGVARYMLLLLQENIDVKKNATTILVEYWNKKFLVAWKNAIAAVIEQLGLMDVRLQRLSGVTENDLKNTTTSLQGVQAILLNLFSANTILIGHRLEDGLLALKLIHDTVVDTSIVFPHWQGLPYKRQLSSLVADYLRKICQDDVCGHNSREDAIACMELMLWKVKEDNKRRK